MENYIAKLVRGLKFLRKIVFVAHGGILVFLVFLVFLFFSRLEISALRLNSVSAASEVRGLQNKIIGLSVNENPIAPSDQLAAFYKTFPSKENILNLTAQLYEASNDYSLWLAQGSYRLIEGSPGLPFIRYEITLPVKGSYGAVRGFVSEALMQLPTLSVDAISLTRPNASDPLVEAELRMTLYLRPE